MIHEMLTVLVKALQKSQCIKDTPYMQLSTTEEMKLKHEINDIYKEYQVFMETSDMPDYNLIFKEQRKCEIAATEYVNGQGHILYISDALFKESNKKHDYFMSLPIYMIKNILMQYMVLLRGLPDQIGARMFIQKSMRSK